MISLKYLRSALFPPRPQTRYTEHWQTKDGPLLYTSDVPDGVPLLFSPGLGASMRDYSGLAAHFAKSQPVVRVGHPGSDRAIVIPALTRLFWLRALGYSRREAAVRVRSYLHRPEIRERRVQQMISALERVRKRAGQTQFDLAGHSFGTDTALLVALSSTPYEIRKLYLFSPHPPGYLIPWSAYAQLMADEVVVVTGTRDWTRDGVGPRERLEVVDALGANAQGFVVNGLAHMDAAFDKHISWADHLLC